jgi:maleylpyruvate isomerase
MVLTHLSANADALCRVLAAAARGEVGEQYPGGREARDAEIEAGRGAPAAGLRERLRGSCEALAAALAAAPEAVWDAPALTATGEVKVGPALIVGRLREVEVHHVDLACGYSPEDWPSGWVTEEMDRALLGLPARLPPGTAVVMSATDTGQHWVAGSGDAFEVTGTTAEIFAWVTGRLTTVGGGECPPLAPWR